VAWSVSEITSMPECRRSPTQLLILPVMLHEYGEAGVESDARTECSPPTRDRPPDHVATPDPSTDPSTDPSADPSAEESTCDRV